MSEPVVNKSKASMDQQLRYLEGLQATKRGLEGAMKNLNARRAATTDPDEARDCDIKHHEYMSAYNKLQAEELVFWAQNCQFRPPTEAEVATMKQKTKELDTMVANSVKAHTIVITTEDLLQQWNATRP